MRAVILCLTAAILIGACGGEARKVTTFQVNGGSIDPWSAREQVMTPEEEVAFRQNALHLGIAYAGDCYMGDDTAYGNEAVFYRNTSNNTSPCLYVGGGVNTTWMFSFDESWARYITQGENINNKVQIVKARVGNYLGRVNEHVNEQFGGGNVYVNNNVPANGQQLWVDGWWGSSFIMCKSDGTGACI